jgi:hypothetical protein
MENRRIIPRTQFTSLQKIQHGSRPVCRLLTLFLTLDGDRVFPVPDAWGREIGVAFTLRSAGMVEVDLIDTNKN